MSSADFTVRIRRAAAAGCGAIEFWRWTNKDLDAIEVAVRETGVEVAGMVAEPMIALTDPSNRETFLVGLGQSVAVARRFGAKLLIAQAGADLEGRTRAEQRAALLACLREAADILSGSGVALGIEPLNTLVDHKGYFLPSTIEALDIIDEVGRPEIRIVYDLYHSAVMDEAVEDVLDGRVDRVAHVHVADHPGRHQPGSGGVDLKRRLDWIFAQGYAGPIGLEYRPVGGTSNSIAQVLRSFG